MHGCITPFVFSTAGGLGPAANVAYMQVASIISEKQEQNYSKTLFWLRRCKPLLRSAIMCLCGSRSSYHHPQLFSASKDLACIESRIC